MKRHLQEKPSQETASTYFNNILRKEVSPLTVTEISDSAISAFNDAIDDAFADDAAMVKERVKYLIPYILQAIDWDEYGLPLESWQLQYYYRRERFEEKTGLRYADFINHRFLMNAVEALGLAPEPTYEFLLFLKYYFDLRSDLRFSPLELFEKLKKEMQNLGEDIRMEFVVGGRHFKFENEGFIRSLVGSVNEDMLRHHTFSNTFEEGGLRDKTRALDYYLVKTLLDYLPIRVKERRGRFSQAERNFGLSILHYCGRLTGDDVEGICSFENNATFDKLMRDFKNARIPFAMELFL